MFCAHTFRRWPNFIRIINFSFGMLGLLTAFMVANQMMEKLGHTKYTINAGLTAISVFISLSAGDRRQRHV